MLPLLLTGITLLDIASAQDCNQNFNSSSGRILSPEYAYRPYPKNLDCQYDIKVSSGYGIKLVWWPGFDVKGYMPSCTEDYVEVFIGCGRNSIGRYCNANNNSFAKPFDMYSADECMRIKFHSDSSVAGRGFRAGYSRFPLSRGAPGLPYSSCQYPSTTLTASSGIISFDQWPSYPRSLMDCKWKIEVGSRKNVKVAFMDLYLDEDCNKMFVEVRGGDDDQTFIYLRTIQGPLCVTGHIFSLTSSEESVWIMFKSGPRISSFSRGFIAGYILYDPVIPIPPFTEQFKTTMYTTAPLTGYIKNCNQNFHSSSGKISSPDYAYRPYPNNLDCQYDISVGEDRGISLIWHGFDVKGYMPDCLGDYVEVFIGCFSGRKFIGRYCNGMNNNSFTRPFDMYTAANCMQIKFHSDSYLVGGGFRAKYVTFLLNEEKRNLPSSCGQLTTLTANSGLISSPAWPILSETPRDCKWKIEVGSRKNVKVAFMDLYLDEGCEKMFVEVRGGDDDQAFIYLRTIKGPLCGTGYIFTLTSSEENVWVTFKTGPGISPFRSRGFVAGYVLYDPEPEFRPRRPITSHHLGAEKEQKENPISTSAIIGIVAGIIGLITVINFGVLFLCFLSRRKQLQATQNVQLRPFAYELEEQETAHAQQAEHTLPPQQPGNTLATKPGDK